MSAVKLAPDIYWVGGIDWNLKDFHGYSIRRGTTYNAYLIVDEKITLIDTVKHYLTDEMLERISQIVDPAKIDTIICNHVEMDHSGGLPKIMEICPNAVIISSAKGKEGLKLHYKKDWNCRVVKTGDEINIGKRNLQFVTTPMVHWPDNMITYCPEEKILFSNDGFGQHLASNERFDDEYSLDITMEEAKKYYANIVLPFSSQVQKELKAASSLDIRMIAPSHGIIWRAHVNKIIESYKKWSHNQIENKAVIIYDTMWESTGSIAHAIYQGFENRDIKVELHDLKQTHISDLMTLILDAKYICVGSPTFNNGIMPAVSAFLTYLKGLAPKNRTGLAFGSYGWGGQSVKQVEEILKSCDFNMLESVKVQYIPDEKTLKEITDKISKAI